jgi:gliding motility-associated-like protein
MMKNIVFVMGLRFSNLFLLIVLFINQGYSQFNISGDAVSLGGGCYRLTPDENSMTGAVWNTTKINLLEEFDITLSLNFGSNNSGADGISFILQPISAGVSSPGSGVGFSGISPSLGVVMDTYQNGSDGDPTFDHMSLHKNGDVTHASNNELVSYTSVAGFPNNVEDGLDHFFRFKWSPAENSGTIQVWFDNVLCFTYTNDIVNTIFGGDPFVYWGVSASTGGYSNEHKVCMNIVADFSTQTACVRESVSFNDLTISGTPIVSYRWDFGDGTILGPGIGELFENPNHIYQVSGIYTVLLEVINSADLSSSTSRSIEIKPLPNIEFIPLNPQICRGDSVLVTITGADVYTWFPDEGMLNMGDGNVLAYPTVSTIYNVVGSLNSCVDSVIVEIVVHDNPISSFVINPEIGMAGSVVEFDSKFEESGASWIWNMENGSVLEGKKIEYVFLQPGIYNVEHVVVNEFGCKDTSSIDIEVLSMVVIPNVFTPNEDGVNDSFVLDGIDGLSGVQLVIFNRWGRVVYENSSYQNDWKAEGVSEGVYFYIVNLPDFFLAKPIHGSVSIFR